MQMPEGASQISSSPDTSQCLIVIGGVHGNEPAGVRAINMLTTLARDGEWKISGNVFGLVGNPRAFDESARFIEENLNRAFGRAEKEDSYEAVRAKEIGSWFKELARTFKMLYVIDLHSVSVGETRIAVFNADNSRGKELAERSPISLHLAYRESSLPGTLVGAIEKLGGVGLVIECGNHSSETGTTVALEHVEDILEALDMLEQKTVTFRGRVMYEGKHRSYTLLSPIKPSKGFAFTLPVESEMALHEGQIYARDENGEHRASNGTYIMMPSKDPQPDDFDAGFLATKDA
jgi:succinylglutamate desuccinylase